jgi:hypothetical protein
VKGLFVSHYGDVRKTALPGEIVIPSSRMIGFIMILVAVWITFLMGILLLATGFIIMEAPVILVMFAVIGFIIIGTRGPRLIIGHESFIDCFSGWGEIPWDQITGVRLDRAGVHQYLCIRLRDRELFSNSSSFWGAFGREAGLQLASDEVSITLFTVAMRGEEVVELMRAKISPSPQFIRIDSSELY